jgi:PAT family beta-lactamase induction signal transducer AmpG
MPSEPNGIRPEAVAEDTTPDASSTPAVTAAASGPTGAVKPRIRDVLRSPKMLVILVFGAASGFPNQVTESALQAWLKDFHVSNTQIGLLTYVSLPYLLKFLWAPLLDRYPLPLLGRRRGWILVTQALLAATMVLLAFQSPANSLFGIGLCALAIVFFSASQDIVIDAYRADVALPAERSLAVTAATLGYRFAAWIAAGIAILVADHFGWQVAILLIAALMAAFAIATVRAPEPDYRAPPPSSLRESIVEPLRELLGIKGALSMLALVMLFKLGDAFALKLFTPFMMDVGFSKSEIAVVIKFVFTASAIGGSILGGLWMVRLGLLSSMLLFGVLQAVSNLAYYVLAVAGKNQALMIAAVIVENATHAMGNVAVVALMMALCDMRFSAFQYALLSVLSQIPRYGLGWPAGWVADHLGWPSYYVISFGLGMPGLAIVWLLRDRIRALDVRH